MKKIGIFGGSGQLGQKVIKGLISSGHNVTSFERREKPSKYGEIKTTIDFNNMKASSFRGDVVIVTIGTTQAKAGSAEAFIAVDFELVKKIGVWAKHQGIKEFHVISSIGAKDNAKGLYLQTKWKMEQSISKLGFEKVFIYRPSIYSDLDRKPFRLKEVSSIPFLGLFATITKSTLKYRPINTSVIAKKIVKSVNSKKVGNTIFEGNDIYTAASVPFKKYRKNEQQLLAIGIFCFVIFFGFIELLGFSNLSIRVIISSIITALSFLSVKSIIRLKKGANDNHREFIKNTKTKNFLRFLICLELLLIISMLIFGHISIAVLIIILLIFDVLFFFNTEDYLNHLK